VLEKHDGNVLALSDLLPGDRLPVALRKLDQRPEAVLAFLREFHSIVY
jgi:hypothetical protein